jgi:hypothetical protein
MRGIQSAGSIHQKGHVMSKRDNEASKFRPSDRLLNDYEQEQEHLERRSCELLGYESWQIGWRTVATRSQSHRGKIDDMDSWPG